MKIKQQTMVCNVTWPKKVLPFLLLRCVVMASFTTQPQTFVKGFN